ncbi:MAG: HNH endonuclease [Deltaproteobacteria bacterium]|nr:HNH endonuclease [Deltaproteobacteria bacterium]
MVSTLLLNAGFEPVKVISWQRAVTLVVTGKADVLEAYDDEIRSPSLAIEVPSVVRMRRGARGRARGVKFCRGNVYRRDEFTCQYCGLRPGLALLTFDHVVPRSRGGLTDWTNIVTACVKCNARKADRRAEDVGLTLSRPPMRPAYMPPVCARDAQHDSWHGYLASA